MNRRTDLQTATLLTAVVVLASACGASAPADQPLDLAITTAMLTLAEAEASGEAVVWGWTEDDELVSLWIRGGPLAFEVLGSQPGVIIPWNDAIWTWRELPAHYPLCDCEAWELVDQEALPCPEAEVAAAVAGAELADLVTGASFAVKEPPALAEDESPQHGQFDAALFPVASVGPFLFVGYRADVYSCGAAHGTWHSEFQVFDLASGLEVDLLQPEGEDHALSAKTERATAFELINADGASEARSEDDLDLTSIFPGYNAGGALTLLYQFTTEASYAGSDDNWQAYSRSVKVPAETIPEPLLPYVLLPPLVRAFAMATPGLRLGGWAPVVVTAEQLERLDSAFERGGRDEDS